ncbi:MAG: M20 family metallopeptidase, partial [Proteocatella sp.]
VLLGAGRILKNMEAELAGNVKLFFQPAEETTGGSKRMIEAGCLENPKVDYVLGVHIDPSLEVGKVKIKEGKLYAASDMFTIKIKGKSAHGASPDKGVDALIIAANVVMSMQTVVSRNISPLQPAVVTIGTINGGTKDNIISDYVEMSGITRTLDEETRTQVKEKMKNIVENIAKGMGGEGELILSDSYAPLINDKKVTKKLREVMIEAIGRENVVEKEFPNMWAEDFSYFAQAVPSCFFDLGVRSKGAEESDLHNGSLLPDEKSLAHGIYLQVKNTLALLAWE